MQLITAVLALVAAAGAVLLVGARLVGDRVPAGSAIGSAVVQRRNELTALVAVVATLGSLYFSEVANFVPCRLCWFQRIAMYPIAVVAVVGAVRRDTGVRWYVVPLAVLGGAVAAYHSMIELGWLSDSESCALFGPSCADVWFETFGFMTLALMALAGFVFIVVLNTISFPPNDRHRQEIS